MKTGNAEHSEKHTRRWEEEQTQTQQNNLCENRNKWKRLREQQSQHGAGQTVIKTVLAVTDLNWTDPKISLWFLY